MAATQEQQPGNGVDEITQMREAVKQQIQEANRDTTQAEQKKANLARQLLDKLQHKNLQAEEVRQQLILKHELNEGNKKEGKDIKKALVEVLEGVKQGIIKPPGKSSALIAKIDQKIGHDITNDSVAFVYPLIQKALERELGRDELIREFNNIKSTYSIYNPSLVRYLSDALVETAQEGNLAVTADQAKELFRIEQDPLKVLKQKKDDEYFEEAWRTHYVSYFTNEDKELVKALQDPADFIKYLAQFKTDLENEMKQIKSDVAPTDISKAVSNELKAKITLLFGKLYTRLDKERPSEFFEQIEQQDFYRGIQTTKLDLKRKLITIERYCDSNQQEINDALGSFKFSQDTELKQTLEEVEVEGNKKTVVRLQPLVGLKTDVELKHFIHYVDQVVDHYIQTREYTHNARAVFLHPPGEKGFYANLQNYSENMPMVDFDEMMLLPDYEIFQQAFYLYDKLVEEQFAAQDWKHVPTMFTPERGDLLTTLEKEVLERLKMIFSDKKYSEERLKSALSMAVGASRGMFLNEVEKAAYADPDLKPNSEATFTSYYTQDANPINAFNPAHLFFRFQTEGSGMNPIFFLPIDELQVKHGVWDHRELWTRMQAYRDSFVKGRGIVKGKDEKDSKLFIDFCINPGDVGGPLKRKGWRTESYLKPFIEYQEGDTTNTKVDHLKTWKNVENIGYELLYFYVNKQIKDNDLKRIGDPKKQELFKYVFKTYYQRDEAELDDYLKELRNEVRPAVRKDINEGKKSPDDFEAEVELVASQKFLYRALARVIGQRIPTKYIRIDRDRMSEDGQSRWKKIRDKMGQSLDEFDITVKDLCMIESIFRKEISKKMKDDTQSGKKLNQISDLDYCLTEEKIQDIITRYNLTEKIRTGETIKLFNILRSQYYNNPDFIKSFANYLQSGKYKFTFAIDETDLSFIPFRSAGPRVLPRAIGDIAAIEQNVSLPIQKFPHLLHKIAISGKHDFSEIIETISKAKVAMAGAIGADPAAEVAHHLAAMAISYFKKDTIAKVAFGIFGTARRNSLAAEVAGRSTVVWEWDATDIDRFCIALETTDILKKNPFDIAKLKPDYEFTYLKVPFIDKRIKLPFKHRKPDFKWYSKNLRKEFGADAKSISLEILNKYLPIALLVILFYFLKKSMEEWFGEKKK